MSGPQASLPKIGTHANAWNAVATGGAANSPSVDTLGYDVISLFGNVNGAVTVFLQYSQDNINFYSGPSVVLAGAADFAIDARPGARYVRARVSAAVTITATIAGK